MNPWGLIRNNEQIERLEKALGKIPADERALILLFYMQEKSMDEISVISGLTLSNVKTRMHRVRKKIICVIKRNGGLTYEHNFR